MNSIYRYQYDDVVAAKELSDLMRRMETATDDRFPARNVFHYDLRDEEKEARSLEHVISVTARTDANELVGYLRVLTDQAYIFYILDVMVDPAHRGHKIGSHIMKMAVDEAKKEGFIKIFLTAIPGKEDFYKQFGFKPGMSPVLTIRGEDYCGENE